VGPVHIRPPRDATTPPAGAARSDPIAGQRRRPVVCLHRRPSRGRRPGACPV